MAAPRSSNNNSGCWNVPEVYKHHEQQKACFSRAKYREGRKDRAVKVYTINLESCYVMVQGVPAIGVMEELVQLCALYGVVQEYRPLDEYPAEQFTEVYLIKFQKLTSARAAKRRMDGTSFYGGVLHVCYVPEYETVEDTRFKLQDRRRYITLASHRRVRENDQDQIRTERTFSQHQPTRDRTDRRRGATGHSSKLNQYDPLLLPPPPQELHPHRRRPSEPTEDKMGTLDKIDAVVESRIPSPTQQHTSDHLRFLPRTTHMESRKRNMQEEEEEEASLQDRPLMGPQMPEEPKLDMEDESLNRSVDQIRSTMKKVESASIVQPPPPKKKKVKPRRRI